eukprot:maker-scaffold_12-snap-gene-10.59-mRNA-1 protein AED:0.07 eAED:0.07 QI:76/1/1/1/0/0.33/3/222/336
MNVSNLLISEKPSFLEVLAINELSTSLKKAFGFFVDTYVQNSSSQLSFFMKRREDEVYLGIQTFLEIYFLKKSSSSFFENFYGLKRISAMRDKGNISSTQKLTLLFLRCILPYIVNKFIQKHETQVKQYKKQYQKTKNNLSLLSWIKHIYFSHFLKIISFFDSLNLIFRVGYLLRLTGYDSSIAYLTKTRVARLGPEDIENENGTQNNVHKLSSFLDKVVSALKFTLLFSAVGFKVIEFYHHQDNEEQRKSVLRNISEKIPPPKMDHIHPKPSEDMGTGQLGTCSICCENCSEPCISLAGFVGCYSCMVDFVEENKCCPVSKRPMNVEQIRKVFAS